MCYPAKGSHRGCGAGVSPPGWEAQALPPGLELGVQAWPALTGVKLRSGLPAGQALRVCPPVKPTGQSQLLLPSCSRVLLQTANLLLLSLLTQCLTPGTAVVYAGE